MSDLNFHLKVVLDGLRAVCADHEERMRHFSDPGSVLDENFDFIVLDYLDGTVDAGLVPVDTARAIRALFTEADEFLQALTWRQEDGLMKAQPAKVREWKEMAAECIRQIEAHNNKMHATNA